MSLKDNRRTKIEKLREKENKSKTKNIGFIGFSGHKKIPINRDKVLRTGTQYYFQTIYIKQLQSFYIISRDFMGTKYVKNIPIE